MRSDATLQETVPLASSVLLTIVLGLLTCWLPAQGYAATYVASDHGHAAPPHGASGHLGACEAEAVGMRMRAWLPGSTPPTPTAPASPSPQSSRQLAHASEPGPRAGTTPLFLLHAAFLI